MEDIWTFVESQMHVKVPAYFKFVLDVCGYAEGFSISAIGEEDLKYIQEEVRNGNVGKAFEDSEEDFLEGCNRTAETFEFVLGHKKFLLAIVDYLKKHLADNGSFKSNEKKLRKNARKTNVVSKTIQEKGPKIPSRRKVGKLDPRVMPLVEHAMATELEIQPKASTVSKEILEEHRKVLLIRMIASMFRITEKLMEEEIETVKQKICGNFLEFELDDDCDDTTATVNCAYCPKPVTVYLRPTDTNDYSWKTPNFERHLRFIHKFEESSKDKPQDLFEEESGKPGKDSKLKDSVVSEKKSRDLVKGQAAEVVDSKNFEKEILSDADEEEEIGQVEVSTDSAEKKYTKVARQDEEEAISINSDERAAGKNAERTERKKSLLDVIEEPVEKQKLNSEKFHGEKPKPQKNMSKEKLDLTVRCGFPILKNGYKTRHGDNFIVTKFTCGFDAIINTFASIYSENPNFRGQIDGSNSKMSEMLKCMFGRAANAELQSSSCHKNNDLYADRNVILKELYEGWCKGGISKDLDTTFIDCTAGIGGLFGRMCKSEKNFASVAWEKSCQRCGTVIQNFSPFLKTTGTIKNLGNISEYLDLNPKERTCLACKDKCKIRMSFNNVVLLETEPLKSHKNRIVKLQNISSEILINSTPYMLNAVMHFEPEIDHFVSYVRDKDNNWKCFDDLKKSVEKVGAGISVNPFMICYSSSVRNSDFEELIGGNKKPPVSTSAQNTREQVIHSLKKPKNPPSKKFEPPAVLGPVKGSATRNVLFAAQNEEEHVSKKRKKRHSGKNKKMKIFE